MTARGIVEALGGRRGRCQCPSCADAGRDTMRNHLSVSERGGTILVHCFAGCEQRAVVESLKARHLWPERERRELSPQERRRWAEAQRQGEIVGRRVFWWLLAMRDELESQKRNSVDHPKGAFDAWQLQSAARRLQALERMTPREVVLLWDRERREHPKLVAEMEHWGARLEAAGEALVRLAIAHLSPRSDEVTHAA